MTVRALAAVAVLTLLAGCGTASDPSPPSGVDGLTIPTPSPDPDDFTNGLGNRWWYSGVTGQQWTYEVTDIDGRHRMVVDLGCGGDELDGVPATSVCTRERGRRTVDYYAQDDAGNVWWLGRRGAWTTGLDGAQAGLAMAATPRVGDGYVMGDGERATVESVDDEVVVPAGSFDDVVRLRVDLADGGIADRLYAPGVGLVREVDGTRTVSLLRYVEGAG